MVFNITAIVFVLSYLFCMGTPIDYARILIVGDSVDRYMVQDWCTHWNGHLHTEISLYTTNHTREQTVRDVFSPYKYRWRSWEIRVCEDWQNKVYMSTVANKFGVKSHPPWHMPLRTKAGLETVLAVHNYSLPELFDLGLLPAIAPVSSATGGLPHGVLLNTAFWDLSHPDADNIRTRANKENWLQSWTQNVTTFMRVVKAALPNTTYFGWHTGNDFYPEYHHWNTRFALELLHDMNSRSRHIAEKEGYDWVDFARYGGMELRDALHPTAPSLVRLGDDMVQRVKRAMNGVKL